MRTMRMSMLAILALVDSCARPGADAVPHPVQEQPPAAEVHLSRRQPQPQPSPAGLPPASPRRRTHGSGSRARARPGSGPTSRRRADAATASTRSTRAICGSTARPGRSPIARRAASGWACQAVPEDRAALEQEIARPARRSAAPARRDRAICQRRRRVAGRPRAGAASPAGRQRGAIKLPTREDLSPRSRHVGDPSGRLAAAGRYASAASTKT